MAIQSANRPGLSQPGSRERRKIKKKKERKIGKGDKCCAGQERARRSQGILSSMPERLRPQRGGTRELISPGSSLARAHNRRKAGKHGAARAPISAFVPAGTKGAASKPRRVREGRGVPRSGGALRRATGEGGGLSLGAAASKGVTQRGEHMPASGS